MFGGNADEMLADRIVQHSQDAGKPKQEKTTQAPPPREDTQTHRADTTSKRRREGHGMMRGVVVLVGAAIGIIALMLLGRKPRGR